MKASFGATGLSVFLEGDDSKKKKLTCIIKNHPVAKGQRLTLSIVDKLNKEDSFAEPGFYMECFPKNISSHYSKKINVYITKEILHQLVSSYCPESGGGFWGTRCKYDRIHMFYFSK